MSAPVLILDGLTKSYGALCATRDVSLQVAAGEIHALIGPNGAGKTTLVRQIYGSETPDSGTIRLCGQTVNHLSVPQRVRRGIGRSFQISNVLMGFTVFENAVIAEAARRGAAFRFLRPAFSDPALVEGAMAILARVGIEGRAGTRVADLAHGEKRLLELALALAGDPALLLLDEPMAGAGPEETQHMIEIIARLRSDVGILLIEHDMDAVFRLADQVTVLVEGAVIASGEPQAVAADVAVRAAYLGGDDDAEA
jgi:branched-chain amino acid transport system ATP-binding protein